ncbi:HET-domain-containing protein [Xylariaceae sp. AK1471]|nr:HET-domain-containing protein [Xylariaceae sp. AK1471]
MRLLNVESRCLREFFDSDIPEYAILSHTWGEEEVSFQDLEKPDHKQKIGYTKIDRCCRQAEADELEWIWVDTCCINKDSSAELSEAINSMFRWYQNAEVCYAYLSDVPPGEDPSHLDSAFRKSRWFTRGWTLQELLAPNYRRFYDSTWSPIGGIHSGLTSNPLAGQFPSDIIQFRHFSARTLPPDIGATVQEITGINLDVLRHFRSLAMVIVAEKMAWASMRVTSRMEDTAYCLLGIFGVNMPLLYGEGNRAFLRLQEEIIRVTYDHSIFAWDPADYQVSGSVGDWHLFARHPYAFKPFARAVNHFKTILGSSHYSTTNLGLHIELPMISFENRPDIFGIKSLVPGSNACIALGLLDVSTESGKEGGRIAMPLALSGDHRKAARPPGSVPFIVPTAVSDTAKRVQIYLLEEAPLEFNMKTLKTFDLYLPFGWRISEYFPPTIGPVVFSYVAGYPILTRLTINDIIEKILIRYYHSDHGSFLLLLSQQKPDSVAALCVQSWWATIASGIERDWSIWNTLLEPDYKEFHFGTLLKTLHWGTVCELSSTQRAGLVSHNYHNLKIMIGTEQGWLY